MKPGIHLTKTWTRSLKPFHSSHLILNLVWLAPECFGAMNGSHSNKNKFRNKLSWNENGMVLAVCSINSFFLEIEIRNWRHSVLIQWKKWINGKPSQLVCKELNLNWRLNSGCLLLLVWNSFNWIQFLESELMKSNSNKQQLNRNFSFSLYRQAIN